MSKFGISQPVKRREDRRFLTGTGDYVDDHTPNGAAFAVFFRSPVAHAKISQLDVSAAREADGVIAVLTAADFKGKLINAMDCDILDIPSGGRGAKPTRPVLADSEVNYAGEAIAIVIAETIEAGKDALELIEVDFDDLPVHMETAVGGPLVHNEIANNLAFDYAFGDKSATDQAFAKAAHRVSLDLIDNRVIAAPMEPRGAFAEWDGTRIHVAVGGQGVWVLKKELARKMKLDKANVRVTNPDVGGGFGMKGYNYPEYLAVAEAARQLNRPVRWMCERGEGMMNDAGGRDHVTTIEAAFDAGHKLTALRTHVVANLGAYNSMYGQIIPSELLLKVYPGVYDVQNVYLNVKAVYTNTGPIDAYRGAGRPEAIYQLERLMDYSARQMGVDAIELRRKNFIPVDKFPYATASGELYDVGDFPRVLDRALLEADTKGFASRKATSAKSGKYRGLGLCYYIESILGDQNETTKIGFAEDGMVDLYVGTQSNGQGHETVFAQILHERSGVPFENIRFVQGDSDRIPMGGGTGGSRSVTMQGNSINATTDIMIEKFKALAEDELEVAAADLVFEDGAFHIAGTDRKMTLMALAEVARRQGKTDFLTTEYENIVPGRSYPNGCHVAEVEVEIDTGATKVVKYTVVDDFGRLMNPMLAQGQVHGGVAQGIGQAIMEHVVYNEDGQLLTGSFMDYALPRAQDVPLMPFHVELTPSTANDIGMKGCGEAGTVGALAAVTNAALDAVWDHGVHHIDMPITPLRMWTWLKAAQVAAE